MRTLRFLMGALVALALIACSDDSSVGVGGDVGDDGAPADADDDGLLDGGGDTGNGDTGGGDTTGDGGGNDQGDDAGNGEFPSCVPAASEECGNGLDDNCNGSVDEACGCGPEGSQQSCYLGAASDLDAASGRCVAGTQTCQLEFWTECTGAIGPIAEDCDTAIDENCDGEVNEGCDLLAPTAICPADFEDDVLSTYSLTGDYELVEGDQIVTFFWSQVSAPPGHSRDITSSGDTITWFADVAGQYTYRFTVTSNNGTDTCDTIFTARTADALRFEMFWNPDYEEDEGLPRDQSDFDLYVLRNPGAGGDGCDTDADCPGYTDGFPAGQACNTVTDTCEFYYYRDNPEQVGLPLRGYANPDSCHWRNCNTCPTGIEDDPEWVDHECQDLGVDELVRECLCRFTLSNPPEGTTPEDVYPAPVLDWGAGDEVDPRLDLDDTEGKGPENINMRRPAEGTYRIAVHFFDPDGFGEAGDDNFRTGIVQIRILCAGGVGYASGPVELSGRDDIPFGYWQGDMWEVGDLEITYVDSNITCDFTPFETEGGCLHICSLQDSDGGCTEAELRHCE